MVTEGRGVPKRRRFDAEIDVARLQVDIAVVELRQSGRRADIHRGLVGRVERIREAGE